MKRDAVREAPIDLKIKAEKQADGIGVSERSIRQIENELYISESSASMSFAIPRKVRARKSVQTTPGNFDEKVILAR